MRFLSISLALVLFQAAALSATIHVPKDYSTIQAAIDAALDGDVVEVDPGTYPENIDYKGKAITVESSKGPDVTTIDGGGSGSVVRFKKGEGSDSVLDGFFITNGQLQEGGGIYCINGCSPTIINNVITSNIAVHTHEAYGAGIYCHQSSPIIEKNVISNNECKTYYLTNQSYGGGIYCYQSSPVIQDNTIRGNSSGGHGGGIYADWQSHPLIMNNVIFENNVEHWGGGIFCRHSHSLIKYNTIRGNSALCGGGISSRSPNSYIENNLFYENTAVRGGGVFMYSMAPWVFSGNRIFANSAKDSGGGVYCEYTHKDGYSPMIKDNFIYKNIAEQFGGGVYSISGGLIFTQNRIFNNSARDGGGMAFYRDDPWLVSNLVYRNYAQSKGGGIFMEDESHADLTNNTLHKNYAHDGGGIFCSIYGKVQMANSILWHNDSRTGMEIWLDKPKYNMTFVLSHSDVFGGMSSVHVDHDCRLNWKASMLNLDPRFADSSNDDYHLLYTSPCRDAGSNLNLLSTYGDFEGDPRVAGGRADMGADEFFTHLYYTGNPTPGGSAEVKVVDRPATSPVLLWVGSGVLENPVQTSFGDWYLEAPLLLELNLGSISPDGITVFPYRFPGAFPAPWDIPMQALSGVKLTNVCVLPVK